MYTLTRRPRRRRDKAIRGVSIALFSAALGLGCGGSTPPPADANAAAIASIDARLRGSFRLVRFDPDVALEPALAALLASQYGTLVIRADGSRLVADSPGIHVDRAYEIREPKGDRFKLVSYDESGVPYESVCEFAGDDQLIVTSQTAPWQGRAILRRAR